MTHQIYSGRNKLLLAGLCVILIVIFFYIANPSLYFFLNDDFVHIPLAAKRNFIHSSLIRPISDLTLWIDYQLYGRNSYGYHITNLLIHIVNCVLVYFLAGQIFSFSGFDQFKSVKSTLCALLFLVYSFHSESIFWIIGRGGSLATVFFLISFILYLQSWSGRLLLYFGSLFFFLLSLFVYEVVWIYPLVIILFTFKRGIDKQYIRLLGIITVFLLFLFLRLIFFNAFPDNYEWRRIYEFDIARLFYNYNTLLARCFIPPIKSSFVFVVIYGFLIMIFIAALVKYRRNKLLFLILGCLLVSVLPIISLGIDTHDTESERFIYLSSVFAILFIIELLFQLTKTIAFIITILLIGLHIFLLNNVADSYKFSGMVTKNSLSCLKIDPSDRVIGLNVPTQYKGALIFRSGLPQALEWFKGINHNKVTIISQKEYMTKVGEIFCYDTRKTSKYLDRDLLNNNQAYKHKEDTVVIRWSSDSIVIAKYITLHE